MITPRSSAVLALTALATLTLGTLVPATPTLAQGSLMDDDDDDDDDDNPCMSSHQMRQFLTAKGYSGIKLNSPIGDTWQATVTRGSQSYLVWVDTCDHAIVRTSKRGTT